ncbi:hypothetical protein Pmani_003688 [Petrolisthes manimaculis]|uniref:Uncharacterized protein n=1 Tax=Petrolisthes manimaculis TaxID=1843537 RepID=A0AAE1UP24_9EUCA|nr:hypothetical protein Pmani_003688 [Petrolisthes manimaculis]
MNFVASWPNVKKSYTSSPASPPPGHPRRPILPDCPLPPSQSIPHPLRNLARNGYTPPLRQLSSIHTITHTTSLSQSLTNSLLCLQLQSYLDQYTTKMTRPRPRTPHPTTRPELPVQQHCLGSRPLRFRTPLFSYLTSLGHPFG